MSFNDAFTFIEIQTNSEKFSEHSIRKSMKLRVCQYEVAVRGGRVAARLANGRTTRVHGDKKWQLSKTQKAIIGRYAVLEGSNTAYSVTWRGLHDYNILEYSSAASLYGVLDLLDTTYWIIIYGVSADVDMAYSLKSGNVACEIWKLRLSIHVSFIVPLFTSLLNWDGNDANGFEISLIPLSRGSFDVIVGMDWLSKRKFVIICHEKVVRRIPLKGDEILQTKEEHEVHLKLVLESLRKEKLYAKFSKLGDALSRKERVKSRRVRGMILAAQSEAFKQGNVLLVGSVMDEAHASRLRWMIYLVVLANAAESIRDAIGFEYCLASSSGWKKKRRSPVLWAEIGGSSLIRPEHKPLEFEVGDRVLLRVSPWKGVVRFGKKGKLAPRYVGPFEILERIGLVAYRFRLPEELNSVHVTFHVSNLKNCLADASLHVPLDDIKVDKTLHFVEELVEIMDREI
ncbi:hypothetical protein Tco_1385929 [Tanacetum coccineum]